MKKNPRHVSRTLPVLMAVLTATCLSAAGVASAAGPQIVIRSVQPGGRAAPDTSRYGLTRDDLRAIVATVPTLTHAVPVRTSTREIRFGEQTAGVTLVGTTADYQTLHRLRVFRGRFLTEQDDEESRNVAVVGSTLVDRLFPEQSPIGEIIQVDRQVFRIVGEVVVDETAAAGKGSTGLQVFIPLNAMQRRLGDREVIRKSGSFEVRHLELSRIELTVRTRDDIPETAAIIQRLLDRRHDDSDFSIDRRTIAPERSPR
ncbi:MAG: ABC transporter permease [Maioricimonas sp. JB045]|uniref:ABC transporter permease n=1 Tax=Maioricimonas sp. JC845 TaxID=3232138 RepID=UPI003459B01C